MKLLQTLACPMVTLSMTWSGIYFASPQPIHAATYYVSQQATNASDTNRGTSQSPWKTISRAGRAYELKPGDQVLIGSGVYRESVPIIVSGEPGRPLTFAAATGARVVIKGSEQVRARWTKATNSATGKEPYPNARGTVWKVKMGEEFFSDPRFWGTYRDKARRWLSQVFIQDDTPLQRIGTDPIYRNQDYLQLRTIGHGPADLIPNSFFFNPSDQSLSIRMAGEPEWFSIEVGVRGFVLVAERIHDVVFRDLEIRHNRQAGGQWPMVSFNRCQRVVVENCQIRLADFTGLALNRCTNCIVRKCDLSYNGNTGLAMSDSENCTVEECSLLFNNYRRFHSGWAAGGMKCIPANRRCLVRACEAAYNIDSDGIWFDDGNSEIRIIGNISHHNGGGGIFYEINKGGGLIADNLVYANGGRGIYISGSQKTWVVHNTVAGNQAGIVCMPRGPEWPLENVQVLNNLLLRNTISADGPPRGCELTLFMGGPDETHTRRLFTNHSDYNIFCGGGSAVSLRHTWNPDNTLAEWQQRFGEDRHSKILPHKFEFRGTGFKLLSREGTDIAGPLPLEIGWQSPAPKQVGASIDRWP